MASGTNIYYWDAAVFIAQFIRAYLATAHA